MADNERARLLSDPEQPLSPKQETPLPWRKIIILLTMRLAEPINFTIIFPFVNPMVLSLLPPSTSPSQVGFYAGIIESTFALSMTLTILYWGGLSDRIGRKPVLLSGLAGTAVSATLFGLSRGFWWAVFARAITGATNGNSAIVKSVIGEITDETNRARAFGLIPLTWTVGCLIGPLLGGYLAKPAEQYPEVFGRGAALGCGGLWEKFPFLLPCAVSAVITMCSIVTGALFLEETLPSIVEAKQIGHTQRDMEARQSYGATEHALRRPPARLRSGSTSSIRVHSWASGYTPTSSPPQSRPHSPPPPPPPTSSIMQLLAIPQIQAIMASYALLSLISVALDAVIVLYLYEPVDLGGVNFNSEATGILLSINGLGGAIVQLFLFSPLEKKVGTLKVYQISMCAFPLSIIFLPLANALARAQVGNQVVWVCLLVSTMIRVVGCMAFASNMILVNQCSTLTRGTALGTLNSLAQMASSSTRAAGPYLANSLFALSVTKNLLGGQMVWLVLGFVGVMGPVCCLMIKDLERGAQSRRSR